MKKIFVFVTLLLIVAMLAIPALAAQTATMTVKSSASTTHRGETITVTVSTTAVNNCSNGGFMFAYDKNAFEYVSGSALVSGYSTSGISTAAGNLAGYFMNGSATVQGNIFQITLKVKDNAAFGTYTFSGTPSMAASDGAVTCSVNGATVTIACNHSYSGWTKVNDTTHKRICSICSKEETANHTWNSGTVTKPASCKAPGEKTFTCTGCNATKTEPIAQLTTHTYGSWTKVNDTTHKHVCTVCSKEETANHTWNSGAVTKPATCKAPGEKTFTCTGCNATKTEPIAQLTTHTYDHACDTSCNICGLTRTTTHNYKTEWSKDKTSHWHECSVCKEKKDTAAHTPGAEATEKTAQTCTVCGYIITPALGHKHSYATTWTTDDTGHWYTCSGCEEKGSYAKHDFENACDKDCSICGYTRETDHKFATEWSSDKNQHWHECTGCGKKQDEAAHEPGAAATETTAQTCTICGYEIAPALNAQATEPAATDSAAAAPTQPSNSETPADKEGGFPWAIVIVAIIVIGGAAVGVILWKKKNAQAK